MKLPSEAIAWPSPRHFAVMGAGAVGCYYGAMLARAGHQVTMIGRPDHVAAMNAHGLRLQAVTFDETFAVQATPHAAGAATAKVVLFCVKSTDTLTAAAELAPHLQPDALLLSLQNGVDNVERMRTVLPHAVIPAVVYVATAMAGAGHVQHFGRGDLVIGAAGDARAEPLLAPLATTLSAAGIATRVSVDVRSELWTKLTLNCAYNALSAIAQMPYGQLIAASGAAEVMTDVVREVQQVARAEGVPLPPDLLTQVLSLAKTMPLQFSSTAQDLMRGKPSEIDHLNGFLVRRAVSLGLDAPVNRVLQTMVQLIQARHRKPL